MSKAKEPIITFEELMAEVAKYRHVNPKKMFLTKQQLNFIDTARKKGVPWYMIFDLWIKAGWVKMNKTTMMKIYYEKRVKK